ncbi:MAG: YidB family protein [Burkholderiales bacterium]|nr:YidB family protein [Burkholderiales bacterium]
MGLLDSVLGSVMGGQAAQPGPGGLGGLGGLGALLPIVTGLLANDGAQGGLGGLMEKFNQAGLGHVMQSWVGKGENLPISGDQLGNVLGGDLLGQLAAKMGVDPAQASGQLSQMLPGLIDQLTPHGAAPQGGLGNAGDLMGMLGGLLHK